MPRQSDKTFRASDVDVEFIELLTASGTFDIRPQLVSFVLYEDIFNPCINIELGINDSVNIPFAGPIVGEEVLNMRFATKSTGFILVYFFNSDQDLWRLTTATWAIDQPRLNKFVMQQALR